MIKLMENRILKLEKDLSFIYRQYFNLKNKIDYLENIRIPENENEIGELETLIIKKYNIG